MADEITVALVAANLPSHEAMQAGIRAELARWDDDDGTHAAEVRYRAMVAVDASVLLPVLLPVLLLHASPAQTREVWREVLAVQMGGVDWGNLNWLYHALGEIVATDTAKTTEEDMQERAAALLSQFIMGADHASE